jgi:hypothetical protein
LLELPVLSLADEMELKPAPITTNKDMVETVLANRFACLAFIFVFSMITRVRGDSNTCSIEY